MKNKFKHWTKSEKEKCINLLKDGISLDQIAKELDRPVGGIRHIATKNGIKPSKFLDKSKKLSNINTAPPTQVKMELKEEDTKTKRYNKVCSRLNLLESNIVRLDDRLQRVSNDLNTKLLDLTKVENKLTAVEYNYNSHKKDVDNSKSDIAGITNILTRTVRHLKKSWWKRMFTKISI